MKRAEKESPSAPLEPIVVVGGILSSPLNYRRFAPLLEEVTGRTVHVAPVNVLDWLYALSSGFGQLVFEVATTVDQALLQSGTKRAILVGHSIGGIVSRVYLGGDPPYGGRRYAGHRRVSQLITLGSPHEVVESRLTARISEVNRLFPGALHSERIEYTSVAGGGVSGKDSALARRFYERLAGDGTVTGDGTIPVRCAALEGSRVVELKDIRHAPISPGPWYGEDRATLLRWLP